MAQLATAAGVRTNASLPSGVEDAQISAHLPAAEAVVLEQVGATIYAAIAAGTGTTPPYTAAAKAAVTRSECLICAALVLRLGLHNIGPSGMITGVHSAQEGTISQLANEERKAKIAAAWEAEAFKTLAPFACLYQEALRDAGSELALPAGTIRVGRLSLTAVSGRAVLDV